MTSPIDHRIPVTVLTGFLGAGKTTVLNHLVRQPDLRRTLVLINEFGEIGLDHLLVAQGRDDVIVEMSSGCLCCTIRGDLVDTLRDAPWRFARGGETWFDRVVIEARSLTSGEKFVDVFMAPYSQMLEPPRKPGRFRSTGDPLRPTRLPPAAAARRVAER